MRCICAKNGDFLFWTQVGKTRQQQAAMLSVCNRMRHGSGMNQGQSAGHYDHVTLKFTASDISLTPRVSINATKLSLSILTYGS